jgi:O-antigen ligase
LLYAIGRYFTSDIEYAARLELIRLIVYASLFFAILNNLHRQESIQIIIFTLIFLAMGISFYAIYQFITNSDRVWHFLKPYHHRGTGTYISPNHLGGFLEMLLPLALAYTLVSRIKHITKVFLGYAAVVICVGIAVTLSRGSWISTALSLLLFFGILIVQRTHRLPSVLFLIVLIGGGLFFIPRSSFVQSRAKALFLKDRVDDDLRFAIWEPAVRIWQDNFWWGLGPAQFDSHFRQYRPQEVQLRPEWVHNDFLNTLVDWGVVGAALVASACGILMWGIIKTWRFLRGPSNDLGGKTSNRLAFLLGASTGLLALFFHSVVDFNMHIPANAILAVALTAMVCSHLRFTTDRFWSTLGGGSKVFVTTILFASFAFLGQQEWRRANEYVWLNRATRAPAFSPAQVALLKKAFAAEPRNGETAFAIGEAFRRQAQEGGDSYRNMEGVDYRQLAEQAIEWFIRSEKLNAWNCYSFLSQGWCLDWLDRKAESAPCFDRAEQLDPNGYFTMASIGLHYVEIGNFAAAKPWFERSLRLQPAENPIAQDYLQITQRRLMEAATNELSARLSSAPR